MTVKEFFKSKSFKCIIALLCVLLVSGIFLTIMNGLLAVSDQERLDRAINKIYGKSVGYKAVKVDDFKDDNASINEAYLIDDGNYLIKSTGFGGFENGTVTCWIVVKVTGGSVKGIDKVIIDSNKGQSYIDRVGSKALNQFTEFYEDGINYTPDLITGATVMSTKNAICNSVNGALNFVRFKCGDVESEAVILLNQVAELYGDKQVEVYGLGEDGSDKLITPEDETVTSFVSAPVTLGKATINSLYKVKFTDGENEVLHFIVSSTGEGGFEKGTVTTLTALAIENGAISGVHKVVITANRNQSYIGKINHLDKYHDAEYTEGVEFGVEFGFVSSGASLSSAAINNAVNGAMRYVEQNIDNLYTAPEGGNETEGGEENE